MANREALWHPSVQIASTTLYIKCPSCSYAVVRIIYFISKFNQLIFLPHELWLVKIKSTSFAMVQIPVKNMEVSI